MEPIIWEWINVAVRWLHVVTAVAWIGSSFYFIHLDLSLQKRPHLPEGTQGEAWQIHGGGFYNMVKYLVAPPQLPKELTWFKWESYATWLSGFFLLCVLYYRGADLLLVDAGTLELPVWGAVLASVVSLSLGWLVYDAMCKSPLGNHDTRLALAGYVFLVAMAWGLTQVFSGRGAMLHLGALIGTMMSANVFFIIIPNQRKTVDAMLRGEKPDPMLGKKAKQRSTHNNYLVLPVIFLMISNHYPLAFATKYNWVIAAIVLAMGAIIRHFFNSKHAGKPAPWWTWVAAAVGMLAIVALSSAGPKDAGLAGAPTRVGFAEVEEIVTTRCSMCHTASPVWEGIHEAPRGVRLDSADAIRLQAEPIRLQAGLSAAMPPGNVTGMTPEERQILAAWTDTGKD